MTDLVARLLLALILVLAVPFVYIAAFIVFEERNAFRLTDSEALLAADIVTGPLFVWGWVSIWRRRIRWTTRRLLLPQVEHL